MVHTRSATFGRGNRQEIDKSATRRIAYLAKLLLELVELMGIEPMTS